MPESREHSPGDDYFNDLSQQPLRHSDETDRRGSQEDNGQIPKPKRIACVLCRKRKLKCDGNKPSCGTCMRLQHDCSYDEVRKKSGPKRGYVKALEARLAQVETMLKTQDDPPAPSARSNGSTQASSHEQNVGMVPEFSNIAIGGHNANMMPHITQTRSQHDFPAQSLGTTANGDVDSVSEEPFPWEMIGLGLDEPLPSQEIINELNQIYFEKVHPSLPMIHRPRYHAAMNLAPHMRPPVCLRYAMWCNAAAVSDKYDSLQEHFYQRARKYIQRDEMKGHGESMITVAHCQTWALIATHEFKLMFFPRAWMSTGRACRMAQMMGLHRLDGNGLDVKQCLPPPRDWTEREERRRTFWMCFCMDRYSSIGTGWPMTMEETDIMTSLPCDEEGYELSKPSQTMNLSEALNPTASPEVSSFAGVVLMACLFGRNLTHLHRPSPDDRDDDINGEFWRRHRNIDNILSNTSMALPPLLRLPLGLNNPNVVFLNMNIHTSTICLHQAAIFKADKNRMSSMIAAESKVRCITAATQIASIMRQVCHLDLSAMNPFISFCLYVAARVFVQYLKSRPKDAQIKTSLQFLLSAMHAMKRKNPLTESFLVQLDVDLEGAGLEDGNTVRAQSQKNGPSQAGQSLDLPTEHLGTRGMDMQCEHATYGDEGLAAYNLPNQNIVEGTPSANLSNTDAYQSRMHGFNLPSRERNPGCVGISGAPRSPGSFNPEMDTSPDGSNNDQQTPASSTQSQHNRSSRTSHTGYSPGTRHQDAGIGAAQMDTTEFGPIFDAGNSLFNTDFDMSFLPQSGMDTQQPGFVLPQTWTDGAGLAGGTGMTPGNGRPAGGMLAGLSGVMAGFQGNGVNGTMADLSEAEMNEYLESFTGWDSGLDDHRTVQETIGRSR